MWRPGNSLAFIIFASLICGANALAGEKLFVVKGGLSPDKRYAVAVVPHKPGEFVDEADGTVYLLDGRTRRKIGPLEEADATGGAWGKTTENVTAAWNPDGRYVSVNFRVGRLMSDFQLYRLEKRRAVPVKLPDPETHPKGRIFRTLTTTANPGSQLRWQDRTTVIEYRYGLCPKGDPPVLDTDELAKLDLPDFDGVLECVYRLGKNGQWTVTDVRTPKTHP